ncbi:hypothetical protein BGZ96_010816 [Linnemannia gamsii]|uniref:Uncharacterized protein n=1 Tax=Linnemannia gamsii TaxID=64522 RepID=A0ABQ7JVB2_9FUNG|nr:hypothetical protein BGZ96_010816 [Linnemannia gamsii]
MKVTLILATVVAASSVSAYQCPSATSVATACRQISVFPCTHGHLLYSLTILGTQIFGTVTSSTLMANPVERATPAGTVVPDQNQSTSISGGAIAGIVIGCLAAVALAGLLAWCWRRNLKSGTHQTHNSSVPANNSTAYNTTTPSVPVTQGDNTTSTNYNTGSNTVHPSTSYNTSTTAGYNTANNGYNSTSTTAKNGLSSTSNTANNARDSV